MIGLKKKLRHDDELLFYAEKMKEINEQRELINNLYRFSFNLCSELFKHEGHYNHFEELDKIIK